MISICKKLVKIVEKEGEKSSKISAKIKKIEVRDLILIGILLCEGDENEKIECFFNVLSKSVNIDLNFDDWEQVIDKLV